MEAPDQASLICRRQKGRIDLEVVGEWRAMEGALAAFDELSSHLAEDEPLD
jgi:hypothetical protein